MTVTAIRHTGIVVQDMGVMLRFFRDLLGFEVWADFVDSSEYVQMVTGVEGADVHMVKMSVPEGGAVELLQYRSHAESLPIAKRSCDSGINHIALQVGDLDSLYQKLKSEGIDFHCPPQLSTDGGAKVTYCRDPEGGILELVEIVS